MQLYHKSDQQLIHSHCLESALQLLAKGRNGRSCSSLAWGVLRILGTDYSDDLLVRLELSRIAGRRRADALRRVPRSSLRTERAAPVASTDNGSVPSMSPSKGLLAFV